EQLQQKSNENLRLLREAEAALTLRDMFLNVAAHELRTPLTILKGWLQITTRDVTRSLDGDRPPDLNKEQLNLRRAVAQTRHLERLVNDMADTTDAAEGKFHLNRQQMRLADILQLIVADERLIAEQHERSEERRVGKESR